MSTLRPALVLLFAFSVLTGAVYPVLVTVGAQLLFPAQAQGSLLVEAGKVRGSSLVGQPFSEARYFWPRPSATTPVPYNAAASSGSNLGPLNPALEQAVRTRIAVLRAADPHNGQLVTSHGGPDGQAVTPRPVPVDLVTASASGLDPHISPAAARYQVARVARVRGLSPLLVDKLVARHVQERTLGLFGERRVNVLMLNLALDELDSRHTPGE